jgi:3-oxoacyl-[acyl-carrier protein] reductase
MQKLEGKVAIVTGAASGFGAAIAERFAREGAKVVAADINFISATSTVQLTNMVSVKTDVAIREDIDRLVAICLESFGMPDIVVNNAGIAPRSRSVLELGEAEFDRMMSVNVKSVFHMVQAVVPGMRKRGSGVLLNIGSTGAIRPRPGLTWYNGSKGAVNVLTRSLAAELAADGIRVNVICPVIAATGMLADAMGMADSDENRRKFTASIPMGRFCRTEDVANAALYLASDEASFITGVEFPVDGGRTI